MASLRVRLQIGLWLCTSNTQSILFLLCVFFLSLSLSLSVSHSHLHYVICFNDRFNDTSPLTEKEFVNALLKFTGTENDKSRHSDFINAFYMIDRSCDGQLSHAEIRAAVLEFEVRVL